MGKKVSTIENDYSTIQHNWFTIDWGNDLKVTTGGRPLLNLWIDLPQLILNFRLEFGSIGGNQLCRNNFTS